MNPRVPKFYWRERRGGSRFTDIAVVVMGSRAEVSLQELKWWDLGACRGLDASLFYPDDDEGAEAAKTVCAGCHVQESCLEHALSFREKAGVWGGATERDRRRLIRQRRRIA